MTSSHTLFPVTLAPACWALCVTALGLASSQGAFAQPASVDVGGLAYLDYTYIVADPDPDLEGSNTFDYRRVYLTADATLDEAFDARVRLEARGNSLSPERRPSPFVKDVWLRWRYTDSGHSARLGVQPPPFFEVVERVWGYRSLDQTIDDRAPLRDSRDFGLRLDGPVVPHVRYGVMVGNGNGLRPEEAGDVGKVYYAQLVYSNGVLRSTLSANLASETPRGEPTETNVVTAAFVGAVTERFHGGAEVFYTRTTVDAPGAADADGFGLSAFGSVDITAKTSIVARYDHLDPVAQRQGLDEEYALLAFAYRPGPSVELMPNVVITSPEGMDSTVTGRLTAFVTF